MKKRLRRTFAILSFLAIMGVIVYSFSNTPPHQFKEGQCGYCHLNYTYPFYFRDNITTLCNYCHKRDKALSHIVGMRPSMAVPSVFHLDERSETTCATCHDVHMERLDPVNGERTYLLRSDLRGKEFCDACHGDTTERVAAYYVPIHAGVFETAHLGYYTADEPYAIDKVSLYCISCHEGATAGHADVTTKTGSPIGASHPIGIDYLRAYRKYPDLRAPRDMSPEIKFFEGKVGCTSCHNPFNLSRHKLSMSMEESRLCFECHLK